ncbi:hypothetical protein KAU33_16175 [Candidatus Dependentiae bacterium]|nr:hypothetical protein [Candidatus Dependentiae bacterium]
MGKEILTMRLSSDDSIDLIKILRKGLRDFEKEFKHLHSEIEKLKKNVLAEDKDKIKRITDLKLRLRKFKVIHSTRLRFVESMEKKIEDNFLCIKTDIKIINLYEELTPEDEKPSCEDCLYNDINFGCTIGREIIDGKCRFYT